MTSIVQGTKQAWQMILEFDPELFAIVGRSFIVSLSATLLAALIAVPLGAWLGHVEFRGKTMVGRILYTLMSLPTVILGLFVFLLISRSGPLKDLKLIYTVQAMIIAQFLLVLPLITTLVMNLSSIKGRLVADTAKTLGANRRQQTLMVMRELRGPIFGQVMTGFARAISEVGAVMIVGGNIRYHTRVMTTAISMLNSMGEYAQAIALGLILLLLSLILNSLVFQFTGGLK